MSPTPHITLPPDPAAPPIHYLRRREIDSIKWDRCIEVSESPLIYGHSWYLDGMAESQWDALMLGDYTAIMPLPWRSKFGIRYLYQPHFTQQTGIFSTEPVTASMVAAFLHALGRHYRFAEIYLNYTNANPALTPRKNFILPLHSSYGQIAANYKKDLTRNLKLTRRTRLSYIDHVDLHTALVDFRRAYASRLPSVKEADYRHFGSLCRLLLQREQLLTRAVLDETQQPVCSAVFLRDARRFYLLHSTTTPAGRALEANHFLLDQFIREWAGNPMILDFEGSDLPGIAHFYRNFGAINQPYFFYRLNRLPWPVRWLK